MAVYPLRTEDDNHQQQQINKFVNHELKVRFQHGNSESSKCNPRISMKNGDSYLMHSDAFKTIIAFMRKYGPFLMPSDEDLIEILEYFIWQMTTNFKPQSDSSQDMSGTMIIVWNLHSLEEPNRPQRRKRDAPHQRPSSPKTELDPLDHDIMEKISLAGGDALDFKTNSLIE